MTHAHPHHGVQRITQPVVPPANATMNITPMIDVLLVLLVIFMAALPLSQRGLDANLPSEAGKTTDVVEGTQIVVEYTSDRKLSINKQEVSAQDLPGRLRAIFENRREKTMFIIGDRSLRYADIVAVIDAATGAGVGRVGIVTDGMRRLASGG